MELKKYFVVKNYILKREDKIDTYGDVFQWWVDPQHNGSNHGRRFINFKETDVKSTSDNILDLVEPDNGDAIGYRFYGSDYEHLEKQSSEDYLKSTLAYNKKYYVITAIYKRQSNGDYKRYEVGGKE